MESQFLAPFKDLFYRCKFRRLIDAIAQTDQNTLTTTQVIELKLLKANAMYELHQIHDSIAALKEVSALAKESSAAQGGSSEDSEVQDHYLYSLARLNYMDNDLTSAFSIFEEIYQSTASSKQRFKSLLGMANVHHSRAEYAKIPKLIDEMRAFEPLDEDDDRITLLIFLGNYALMTDANGAVPRGYFTKALAAAANRTWTYWINRCFYGLARLAEKTGDMKELEWTLNILRSFVDQSESLFFSFLVNDRFKDYSFAIETEIEFDTRNKRILLHNKWVNFHDRPLVYSFLETLKRRGEFTTKDAIAKELWPTEDYKPKVHDPRIFDIAKRARGLIETYEHQPVVLLSGRLGYKLAST